MINLKPEVVAQLERVLGSVEMLLPRTTKPVDWKVCYAANWRRHSFSGYLEPVKVTDTTTLDELLGVEEQKTVMLHNTRQFLAGLPANNVLLWGARGTGKSTLVRAMLHRHAAQGLRLVQVDKDDLVSLPAIVAAVVGLPYRFLIFSDDLSFETGDPSYKVLKSALDGAVYALPENVLIYVTSNRRHLIPEYESDDRGAMMVNGELHQGEAVEEKMSLSGRFGLWVAFHPFSQALYLDAVREWVERLAAQAGAPVPWTPEAEAAAIAWCRLRSDRSGRIAYQFACDHVGRQVLAGRAARVD